MKKIINEPAQIASEALEGFLLAYPDLYERVPRVNGFIVKSKQDKVQILIGGGSGHEPMFSGFAGYHLADAVANGNVFASPDPKTILEVTRAADCKKGVLYLYGNYAGDNLNFEMASELAQMEGIQTAIVRVNDDAASAPLERKSERRGIAGDVFAIKMAGAASSLGYDLETVRSITQRAVDQTRSIGIALSPASLPNGKPNFTIGPDEMEFGMGIHGEPGIRRDKLSSADTIVTDMMRPLLNDLPFRQGDEVCLLVNGLGSTTLLELYIMNRKIHELLSESGIGVYDTDIHSYCTTLEMGGASISLIKLDSELKKLYDMEAWSPYYCRKGKVIV